MIRQTLLLVGCTLFSLIVASQIKKGMYFTGSTFGSAFSTFSDKEISFPSPTEGYTLNENGFNISFNPYIGTFISNRTALGYGFTVGLNTNSTSYTAANGNRFRRDKEARMDAGINIFLRQYFLVADGPRSNSFYAQGCINTGFSSMDTEGFSYGVDYKDTYEGKSSGGFYFTPGVGFGWQCFVSDHVAFDFGFSTQWRISNYKIKTTTLRDELMNGTIDQTFINEPRYKETTQTIAGGIGLIYFFDKLPRLRFGRKK
jgi:hypothetical protein